MDSSADNTSFAPESPDLTNYYAPDILSPVQTHHPHYNYTTSAVSTPYAQTSFPPQPQSAFGYAQNFNTAYSHPAQNQYPADMAPRTRAPKREAPEDGAWTPDGQTSYAQPENGGNEVFTSGAPDPSVDLGIFVKTKFPVARIKRIMQADDDVGKVAQVTPVVVSKALELFMINLITRAATEAKQRNQKRVAAAHLKTAITNDSQFDFLEDIVKKVADAPANAEKAEDDDSPGGPKKRKTTTRRRRKESTDSD